MPEELNPYQAIKHELICGNCKSAKFMFWQSDQLVGEHDAPNGSVKDRKRGMTFLIRCEFYRITVKSPAALLKCEGLRQKSKTPEN